MKIQIINTQTNEKLQEFDLVSVIRHNRKCIVGRSTTSNLILGNSDISRSHGEFSYHSGKYYFTDTGSSNGSLINNQSATKDCPYLLKPGDVIRLGDFLLILQSIAGVHEDATVIAPIPFTSLSNGAKTSDSEIPSSPEIIREQARPADQSTWEELPVAAAAQPEDVEQTGIDNIPSKESIEDIPPKVTDVVEAPTPPEVVAESDTTQIPDAIAPNANREDSLADAIPNEGIPVLAKTKEATSLQQLISPEATAESDTAEIRAVIAEKPKFWEEYHTDTTVAQKIVEEKGTAVAQSSVPVEVAQASAVGESSELSTPFAPTPTENVEAIAAELTKSDRIQTGAPEFIDPALTNATVSPISEVTDKELGDRNHVSAVSEILKEKYIVLLAHDSQKAELVDFIVRHQETFSECLLVASSNISEVLDENNIFVRRVLSNLTAGGYQEVNSLIASKNLLGVIFLRDFLAQQPSQANDEALSRACNVNPVVLATNIATAQAFEGYLQHLIASTPKVSLAEAS